MPGSTLQNTAGPLGTRHGSKDPSPDQTALAPHVPPAVQGLSRLIAPSRPAGASELGKSAIAGAALLVGDLVTFTAGGAALGPFGAAGENMPAVLALSSSAAAVLLWADGLYPGYGIYPHEILRRRMLALTKVATFALAGAISLGGGSRMQALLLVFPVIVLPLQLLLRPLICMLLKRLGCWGTPAEIFGDDTQVAAFGAYFAKDWQLGIRCEGPGSLPRNANARLALVATRHPACEELEGLRRRYHGVILLAGIPGTGTSGLRPADVRGEIGLRLGPKSPDTSWPGLPERALDLVAAGGALLVSAPLLILAAASIYAVDPGPVIYRQNREGAGGRQFRILKLRTMYQDADLRLEMLLASDPAARAEWERHFKLRKDPRILPVIGRFLRASSIDELPQLLNVLAGDMRLVGPRPFPLYHLASLDAKFRAKRRSVRPGITGLWQTTGRSDADLERQQALDGFYLDNRSIWFDLHILIATVQAVLRREGAY